MSPRRPNFADPDYEPTDEDLLELTQEAFAGLAEERARSLREMNERIARAQREALRDLELRRSGARRA